MEVERQGLDVYIGWGCVPLHGRRLSFDSGYLRHISSTTHVARWQVVLQDDEDFPFISVRIVNPGFVLNSVATVCLHLVACDQPRIDPFLPHRHYIVS